MSKGRNTVVALGELHRSVGWLGDYTILEPGSVRNVAKNLMTGAEPLEEGTPVLVVALPDVEPETVQRIVRAVQETRFAAWLESQA